MVDEATAYKKKSYKVGEGGGFGFEGGGGFDEAGDGEGVADAPRAADQAQHATFVGVLEGDSNQRGKAGAVDLRRVGERDDHVGNALLDDRFQGAGEQIAVV